MRLRSASLAAFFSLFLGSLAAHAEVATVPRGPAPPATAPEASPAPVTSGPTPPAEAAGPVAGESTAHRYLRNQGRGWAWLYGGVELGGTYTRFDTITSDNAFAGGTRSGGTAPVVGATLGARLSLVSLGVRSRVGFFSDYQALVIGPELGLHFPIGEWEPNLSASLGYTRLLNVKAPQLQGDGYRVSGLNARLALGLDRWVSPHVTVGGSFALDLYALTRPETILLAKQAKDDANPQLAIAAVRAAEGSSVGAGASLIFNATYHF